LGSDTNVEEESGLAWWYMLVISATQEAEKEGLKFKVNPGQKKKKVRQYL
jgi:hypothetical protein